MYKHRIPKEVRNSVFERDGYNCVKCGSKSNLTLDHILPKRMDGEDSIDNLQTMCYKCNQKKHHLYEDYITDRKKLCTKMYFMICEIKKLRSENVELQEKITNLPGIIKWLFNIKYEKKEI
jgi:hypothetical protein